MIEWADVDGEYCDVVVVVGDDYDDYYSKRKVVAM